MTVISVCQFAPAVGRRERTRAGLAAVIGSAAANGAAVVVVPELSNSGYMFTDTDELRAAAEPADGPTVTSWVDAARRNDLVIVGGFAERAGDAVYNSAVLVDPSGIRAVYRKAHLWNTEKTIGFAPGDAAPPVIDTPVGRIAVMICYDLEFPEWVRMPALAGAELLCAPANWPDYPRPVGERPGEIVRVQADAAVNRMVIAVADRAGSERGQAWVGGSVVVDADGYPVTPLRLGEECTLAVDVDLAQSRNKSISDSNDVFADRRPGLYASVARQMR